MKYTATLSQDFDKDDLNRLWDCFIGCDKKPTYDLVWLCFISDRDIVAEAFQAQEIETVVGDMFCEALQEGKFDKIIEQYWRNR